MAHQRSIVLCAEIMVGIRRSQLATHLLQTAVVPHTQPKYCRDWELGLTSSGVLGHSGFDTHNRHDASHPNALQNLLLGIHLILQEAETRGVPVVMVVTSEFGRTDTYNAADGKDHWPSTSWMLLQTKGLEMFQTGRLFGGSLYDNSVQQIRPMALNMETLAPDEEGSLLNPEALHVWLRGRAGLKDTLMSEHLFPLRNAVWPGLDTLI